MTTKDKITQIILECAPLDMTIAQIKLMSAKLTALVDEVVSDRLIISDTEHSHTRDTRTENDTTVYNDDFTPSDKKPLDPPSKESQQKIAELGIDINYINDSGNKPCKVNRFTISGYDRVSKECLDKLIAHFMQQTGVTTIISKDGVYVWRNGERDKIVYDYNGEKITLGEPYTGTLKPSKSQQRQITI